MTTDIDTKGFNHILALDNKRTPGQIIALGQALRFGNYIVKGFIRGSDALYLSTAANVLPKLIRQLNAANKVIDKKNRELAELRRELRSLRNFKAQIEEARQPKVGSFAQMIDATTWEDLRNGHKFQLAAIYTDAPTPAE
jgi:hypothetical protein